MIKCIDCEHGVFCESWSEWKCLKHKQRMHNIKNCKDFTKRTSEERPCQCKACIELRKEEMYE